MNLDWLTEFYKLSENKSYDQALDLLFIKVDDAMYADDWLGIDSMLQKIDINRLETNLLVGILTATLPGKSRLAERADFYQRARSKMMELAADRIVGLTSGLE